MVIGVLPTGGYKPQKGDYMDVEIFCGAVGEKVTIRCTREGIIVCKYPWQKCKPRKENSDRDHCLMTAFIEDLPREVELLHARQESMTKSLITWLAFKKRLDELGIELPNR
uniref:Uncharacterized protein n=1 Tax=viral metagenome TaxID=1070528 RepID=A0A6M3M873_9ZZZZ